MNPPMIERLEAMLARGQDSALLRFSLGNAWLSAGNTAKAAEHLQAAVTQNPDYSAAWKLLGKALTAAGRLEAACAAYRTGIETAERQGDVQAGKEMRVFLKRLQKTSS